MKLSERTAYLTRDAILKLLSDDEVARVSTAEAVRLSDGDEYIDLGQLNMGVRQAHGTSAPTGRLLPRSSVHDNTWDQIVAQLARPVIAHEDIAFAAYFRYLSRGLGPGGDLEDWLEAERNLRASTT